MSSDAFKKFDKILEESGASVGGICFQWMFDDNTVPANKLLHWIANNITSDNYLTITEQREYNELLNEENYLTGAELEEAMDSIEKDYPGIFNDDNSSSDILEQLEELKRQTEVIQQCLNEYESSKSTYQTLENEYHQSLVELKATKEDCENKILIFQDAESELRYVMLQIQKLFDNDKKSFLSQNDLVLLIQQLDLKRNHAKLYLEKQFPNLENSEHIKTDLMMLYELLVDAFYYEMSSEADMKAWKLSIEEVHQIYNKFNSITNIEKELENITVTTQNLEIEDEYCSDQLRIAAERYVLQLLMKVQYEENEHKLAKRKLAFDRLKVIEKCFHDSLCRWEILWRMLVIEGKNLDEMQTLYIDAQSKHKLDERNAILRIYDLKKLLELQIEEQNSDKSVVLHELFLKLFEKHDIKFKTYEENSDVVGIYNKLVAEKDAQIDIYTNKLGSIRLNIKKLDAIINDKNKQILCDISKSPICISPVHYAIYNCKYSIAELEAEINAAKNTFVTKKKSLKSNEFLDAERNLWIYFLCEPNKMLSTLDYFKDMIKDNSRLQSKSCSKMHNIYHT